MTTIECVECVDFVAHDPRGRQVSIAAGIFAGLMANPQEQDGDPMPMEVAAYMGQMIVKAYTDVFHAFNHIPLETVTDDTSREFKQAVVDAMMRGRP